MEMLYKTKDLGEIQTLLMFKHELKDILPIGDGVIEFIFIDYDGSASGLADRYRQGKVEGDLLAFSLMRHHVISLIRRAQKP